MQVATCFGDRTRSRRRTGYRWTLPMVLLVLQMIVMNPARAAGAIYDYSDGSRIHRQ